MLNSSTTKILLILGTIFLFADMLFSFSATCNQISQYTRYEQSPEKYCTALSGPIGGNFWRLLTWVGHFLHEYDKEIVALFTAMLTVSTVALWWSTRKLWLAGEKQLRLSERSLVDVERAFVFIKQMILNTIPSGLEVVVQWENSGTTPARRLLMQTNWEMFPGELPDDFDFPDRWDVGLQHQQSPALIGPKGNVQQIINIPDATIQAIRSQTHHAYIWGWAEYDDVFNSGIRHRTEFCSEVIARDMPDGSVYVGCRNFRRHNAAEDDCMKQPHT